MIPDLSPNVGEVDSRLFLPNLACSATRTELAPSSHEPFVGAGPL